jgi:hypothetical protein
VGFVYVSAAATRSGSCASASATRSLTLELRQQRLALSFLRFSGSTLASTLILPSQKFSFSLSFSRAFSLSFSRALSVLSLQRHSATAHQQQQLLLAHAEQQLQHSGVNFSVSSSSTCVLRFQRHRSFSYIVVQQQQLLRLQRHQLHLSFNNSDMRTAATDGLVTRSHHLLQHPFSVVAQQGATLARSCGRQRDAAASSSTLATAAQLQLSSYQRRSRSQQPTLCNLAAASSLRPGVIGRMVRQLCSSSVGVCDVELFDLFDLGDINDISISDCAVCTCSSSCFCNDSDCGSAATASATTRLAHPQQQQLSGSLKLGVSFSMDSASSSASASTFSERLAASSAAAVVSSDGVASARALLQQEHDGDIDVGVCKAAAAAFTCVCAAAAAAAAARRRRWRSQQRHALAGSFRQHGAAPSATCLAEAATAAALSGSL